MRKHADYARNFSDPLSSFVVRSIFPTATMTMDGKGYPRGIKGAQIPLAARIFAIADVWDALRSDRLTARPARDRVIEHMKTLLHPLRPGRSIRLYADTRSV